MTLRERLGYWWLAVRSALGLLPPPPAGLHAHACRGCGARWTHEPGAGDFESEHRCPRCGVLQFMPEPQVRVRK